MRRIYPLCYHKVTNDCVDFNNTRVSISNFESQMRWLLDNFDIIRLGDIEEKASGYGRDAVAITFDDGYADVLLNALPILERYGIPATVFVTTGNIGTPFANYMERIIDAIFMPVVYKDFFELKDDFVNYRWKTKTLIDRLNLYSAISQLFKHIEPSRRKQYEKILYSWAGVSDSQNLSKRVLNAEELKKLSENSLITIGSHTVNHTSLKWISNKQQEYELCESKRVLEEITGKRIDLFAYPWGTDDDYTDQSIEIIRNAGYKYAFTTTQRELDGRFDPYRLPRWICFNYEVEDFRKHIDGFVSAKVSDTIKGGICCPENIKGSMKVVYIGKLEGDACLESEMECLIWGYGFWGKKIYKYICYLGRSENIIGFGDNDFSKHGIGDEGLSIYSLRTVIEMQARNPQMQIIVSGNYCWDMCYMLLDKGLGNIHVII